MALIRPTQEEIYTRIVADMEARVTGRVKIPKVSLLGILAIVFTGAIHLVYGLLQVVAKQLFIDTATGTWLDRWALLYKLPRKAATYTVGSISFTGTEGATIAEGVEVQNGNGFTYVTLAEVAITGGNAQAEIQAVDPGSNSNDIGSIITLVAPLPGVNTDVDTVADPNGGQDLESDDALRRRLIQRIQNPPASGTVSDYDRWALEIPGVGRVWTQPAEQYAGAGTVGIVIATEDLNVVDPAVKENTQTYINSVSQTGIRNDVLDPDLKQVSFEITLSNNTQEYRENVTNAIEALFLAESVPGGTLLLTHIQSAISSTGINDYRILDILVEGSSIGVTDIILYNTELAIVDAVNIGGA